MILLLSVPAFMLLLVAIAAPLENTARGRRLTNRLIDWLS